MSAKKLMITSRRHWIVPLMADALSSIPSCRSSCATSSVNPRTWSEELARAFSCGREHPGYFHGEGPKRPSVRQTGLPARPHQGEITHIVAQIGVFLLFAALVVKEGFVPGA